MQEKGNRLECKTVRGQSWTEEKVGTRHMRQKLSVIGNGGSEAKDSDNEN
jgi:hypothetical protein